MIQALLEYQNSDAKLFEIEKKLAGSEERKKAVSAKKYLEGVEENVNRLDMRASELAHTLQQTEEEEKKLKEQENEISEAINAVEDEKEAAFLIKKAEELVAKIKSLSQKAQKIMEEIQAVMKEYQTIKNTTKAAQAQYNENAKKYSELKESVKTEKESAEKELEKFAKQVDPALLQKYLDKRKNKMYPILYALRNNVCGACNMELSMSELNKLKNGEIIECGQCGRLVYSEK